MEVPRPPRLGAVHHHRENRDALLERHHRRARLYPARDPGALARSLDEPPEPPPLSNALPHRPDRLPIRLSATHGERPERANQLTEPGDSMRLDLRHVVHRPGTGRTERRRVDPGEVVAGDHDPALTR